MNLLAPRSLPALKTRLKLFIADSLGTMNDAVRTLTNSHREVQRRSVCPLRNRSCEYSAFGDNPSTSSFPCVFSCTGCPVSAANLSCSAFTPTQKSSNNVTMCTNPICARSRFADKTLFPGWFHRLSPNGSPSVGSLTGQAEVRCCWRT